MISEILLKTTKIQPRFGCYKKLVIRLKMRHLNNTFCLSFSMLSSALSSPPSLRAPFNCPFPLVPDNSGVDVFGCLYLGADVRGKTPPRSRLLVRHLTNVGVSGGDTGSTLLRGNFLNLKIGEKSCSNRVFFVFRPLWFEIMVLTLFFRPRRKSLHAGGLFPIVK